MSRRISTQKITDYLLPVCNRMKTRFSDWDLSLDMVVEIMFMSNVWKSGWSIRYQPVRRWSNVHSVERHSVHSSSSNKNFGREIFIHFFLFRTDWYWRTSGAQQAEKSSIHLGYSCHRCRACPITGKCYRCTTCHDYFLCQTCFNLNIHNEHSFDYREVEKKNKIPILGDETFWSLEIISTLEIGSSRTFNSITKCSSTVISE